MLQFHVFHPRHFIGWLKIKHNSATDRPQTLSHVIRSGDIAIAMGAPPKYSSIHPIPLRTRWSPGHPYLSELTIIGCKSPLHCNPTVPPCFNCFIRAFGPRFAILGLYYRSTRLQIVSISPPFSGQIEMGSIDPQRRLEHRHAGPSPPMVTNRYCGGVFPQRRPSHIARSDGGISAHQRSRTC